MASGDGARVLRGIAYAADNATPKPQRVHDDEFHTLTGFRRDEAEVRFDALHDVSRRT
jgi:hypothetical protein